MFPKNSAWTNSQETDQYLAEIRKQALQQPDLTTSDSPSDKLREVVLQAESALIYDEPEQAEALLQEVKKLLE